LSNSGIDLEIQFEPDPDQGRSSDPDLSHSWARFAIHTGGYNLCQHVVGDALQSYVHWYTLPLIEWFLRNWDRLFNESRIPDGLKQATSARQSWLDSDPLELTGSRAEKVESWWHAHALRSAASGGIFPDVFLRRYREGLEVSWGHAAIPGFPSELRFLTPKGKTLTPIAEAASTLHSTLGDALATLERNHPSPRIERLLHQHEKLQNESRPASSWLAALDSFPVQLDSSNNLFAGLVVSPTPAPLALFGSLAPNVQAADVDSVLRLLADVSAPEGTSPPPVAYRAQARDAWQQGYELAEAAREHLELSPEEKPDLEAIFNSLHISRSQLKLTDEHIRAIAIFGSGFRPHVAINESCRTNHTTPGKRFTLAHELCHLLFDQENGRPLVIASGPWAPFELEQRANAFAAMFLMPIEVCRKLVSKYAPSKDWDVEVIIKIARELETGKISTLHHLANNGLIPEEDREMLQAEFDFKSDA
jgi:Zn-dependent peptidase ImmA (M78 family)